MRRRRTLTLRRAIVLMVMLGLLIPALLISGYSWINRYNEDIRKQTEGLLQQNAAVLATGMQEPLWNLNQESGNALLEAMMSRDEDIVRIEVRDNALGVFVSGEHPERRDGYTAVTEKPVLYHGSTIGSVQIEVGSTRLRRALLAGLLESTTAMVAQAALSIVLILLLLDRRLVRPLQRISLGAERLAQRQLEVPFTWQRLDEIGLLSRRMEDTRISLRKLFDELDRKNRELEQDITDKRRAEEALSLSEAKFAGAFDCNPEAVAIVRMGDGVIIDVNQTFAEMTGYARDEAVGRTSVELQMWVKPEQRIAMFRELRDRYSVRNIPWEMRIRHGVTRQCLTNGTIFTASNERYILVIIRDVTDQRQLEEQKAEADRALLRLAQGTRDIAGESFFDLLVADLASALGTDCAFIGLRTRKSQDLFRTIAAHERGHDVGPFDFASAGTPYERTLEDGICVYASDVRRNFPADHLLSEHGWESYAGTALRDAAGNPIGVLAVLHSQPLNNPDLVRSMLQVFGERASAEMERKRAEEELRASEQRFSTIFQSSPIAMFVTQVRGNYIIKDVNRAFEQLFLRSRAAVFGKNTSEIGLYCNPEDRAALIAELKRTGTADSRPEIWMLRGDGSRVLVEIFGHTFTLAGDRFGILACTDVTDKRRIENEIRELNATLEQRVVERTEELQQANEELEYTLGTLNMAQEELVRSEKLAALGSLVAGVAHELNTPIGNSLMVASTLLDQSRALGTSYARDNGIKRSTLENYITDTGKAGDILVRNLQRAANLVTSFKQVAVDQTSSQRRTFSVAEVVAEIMLTLWPTLKKTSFTVKQDIAAGLKMDSYPGPLGQVITNLVNNALLHGFEGRATGTVLISAHESADGWLEFVVRDDGVGIPPANLNRVFDPFFTTKLGSGGSGLGLNIAHNIVTGILGGRIRMQSEVGRGTSFFLNLPLVAPQRQHDDEAVRA
ncbi:PAS domain S-box protein [Noviherbaspirillum sp. UKPF54]|uniref:PAS domain S-box protein n=1 Tax=Noviherbaspirillum sp. UKPF54 TaxID=2601898 RepID=UPI001FEF28DA|nr:PAS domain S-box protein [Noviherbaspirillum sp. UKPF54]